MNNQYEGTPIKFMKKLISILKNIFLFLSPKTDVNEAADELLFVSELDALAAEQEQAVNQKFEKTFQKHLSNSLSYSHNKD